MKLMSTHCSTGSPVAQRCSGNPSAIPSTARLQWSGLEEQDTLASVTGRVRDVVEPLSWSK